ncbi:MAG: VIT1/CCC1 transporter family protein [Pseudonocardiaceae bacterium]
MTDAPEPEASARAAPGWSHQHRDVSGGWLRPTVFGAMDGLITNASLIVGVGGGGAAIHTLLLTGLAGLAAGSLSMAAGEYISVTSQNELTHAETQLERDKIAQFPDAEREELTETLTRYGLDLALAAQAATAISRHPDTALRMHTREELGVDPDNLPSPWVAAGASLLAFAVGAAIPLLPYLAGARTLLGSLIIVAIALFGGGATVGVMTQRPVLRSGARQLLLGALAAAVTFGIGRLIGTSLT